MVHCIARITVLFGMLMLFAVAGSGHGLAQENQHCFEETGYCVQGRLYEYWEQNGGLPVFGYPITPQQVESIEGQQLEVQWFERNRLELHPQNERPYDVLLGRLGADGLQQQGRDWQSEFARSEPQADCRYFEETGHNVCGDILAAWRASGLELDGVSGKTEVENMALFGLPLSDAHTEMIGGQEYTVQWFERARFELHPENEPPFNVLLGLLGNEMSPTPQSEPQPGGGGTLPEGWQEFTSEAGRFLVAMPGTPGEEHKVVTTDVGAVDLVEYLVETDSGMVAYIAAYSDFPAEAVEAIDDKQVILDSIISSKEATTNLTITEQHNITIDGHLGVEFVASGTEAGQETTLKSRCYLVGNRLYQLIAVGIGAHHSEENANLFLSSFALLP